MDLFGVVGLGALALVVVVILIAAALFLRNRFGHSSGVREHRTKPAFASQPRLEVLETTDIDEERRLVLVRCDGVEHLIMTGGAGDVVVENDVRKVRGAAPTTGRGGAEPNRSLAALMAAPAASPPPQGVRAEAPALPRHATTNGSGAARQGAAGISAAPRGVTAQPAPEIPPARREPVPQWRSPQPQQAATARTVAPSSAAPGPLAIERRPLPAPLPADELPNAATPWPDSNSIEDEIVEALRFERSSERPAPAPTAAAPQREAGTAQRGAPAHREPPAQYREPSVPQRETPIHRDAAAPVQARAAPAAQREPVTQDREPPVRERRDTSGATLGDLAERLEEALAREVQFSNHGRDFEADFEAPAQPESAEPRRRLEPKRSEARSTSAEVEPRRESAPDRREEAPVISLSSRRREAVDPLEDEMARLLGELTGDTKSR